MTLRKCVQQNHARSLSDCGSGSLPPARDHPESVIGNVQDSNFSSLLEVFKFSNTYNIALEKYTINSSFVYSRDCQHHFDG